VNGRPKSTRPEPKPSAFKTTKSDQLVALQRRNSREIPVPGGGAIVQLGAAATDARAKAHDGVAVNAVIRSTERMLMPSVRAAMISIYFSGEDINGGPNPSCGGDVTDQLGLDPLLIALLKKVPSPDKGWPGAARVRWFRTLAMNVSQISDGDGGPSK
jgi:hypothetical protein